MKYISTIIVLAVLGTVAATCRVWLPYVQELFAVAKKEPRDHSDHQHGHDGHQHDQGGHYHDNESDAQENSFELSELARKNIGLTIDVVKPTAYVKTVSVPATVVERPGRSRVEITASLTGIVTRVYPMEGEAIEPGQPLFDLRLTHEDLVTAQREFLQSAEELEVVTREITRLKSVGEGIIAGRRVLDQEYEQQKIKAALHAQRQGLLLHGLSQEQVNRILTSRQLLPMLTVAAPPFDEQADHQDLEHLYHVQSIVVRRGQSVAAGQTLALLADHCLLHVEGQAFEDDAQRLIQATSEGWLVSVSAVAMGPTCGETVPLKIFRVADHVDRDSRVLRFYLSLPNELIRDEEDGGHRFVAWHYRPGQRMEVKIPIGQPWENQIVLSPEAVVTEGADAFVFEQNGDRFDRVAVHVIYRDKDAVVIENDGTLTGSTLAMSGAYDLHLAIKNKAGGGAIHHAGHTH